MKIQQINNFISLNQQMNAEYNSKCLSIPSMKNDSVSFKSELALMEPCTDRLAWKLFGVSPQVALNAKSFKYHLLKLFGLAKGLVAVDVFEPKRKRIEPNLIESIELADILISAEDLAQAFKKPEADGSIEVIEKFLDSSRPEGAYGLEIKEVFGGSDEHWMSKSTHLTKEEFLNGLRYLSDEYQKKLLLDNNYGRNYEKGLHDLAKEYIPNLYSQAIEDNKTKVHAITDVFKSTIGSENIETILFFEDGTRKKLNLYSHTDYTKTDSSIKPKEIKTKHNIQQEITDIISDIEKKGIRVKSISIYDYRLKDGRLKPIIDANSEKLNFIDMEYVEPHVFFDHSNYEGTFGEKIVFKLFSSPSPQVPCQEGIKLLCLPPGVPAVK